MKNVTIISSRNALVEGGDALNQLIERFLNAHDVKDISRHSYRRRLRDFTKWITALEKPAMNRDTIVSYKRSLRSRKFSANTQSAYMVAVRSFFTWLETEKIYPNLAKGIKGAKREKGFRKDPLTIPQIFRLLESIDRSTLMGKRDFALLNTMIRTGPRSIECTRCDAEDLRQEAGQAVLWLQGKGSDSKDAFVVLTESTLTPILEYLSARGNVRPTDPLFASVSDGNAGDRLSTRAVRRIAKQRLRGIAIDSPRISAHSMRHTAVTLSLIAGASLQETQQMARHASPVTTMIYAQNLQRASGVPEKKIDELLRQEVRNDNKD